MFNNHYTPLNKIYLSKSALNDNITKLQKLALSKKCLPVLKSNAYGHDLPTIYILIKDMHFPLICVDSIYEAFQVYKINSKQEVLIMGYIDPKNLNIKQLPFQYVVWSLAQMERIAKYQTNAKFHIFVDTGMHREGICLDELELLCKTLSDNIKSKIVGLISHFASSEEIENESNKTQNDNFSKAIEIIRSFGIDLEYIHIEASAGTLRNLNNETNAVRLGLGIYGISPIESNDFNLKPILKFKTQIVQVKDIKKGEKVGYNGTFEALKDMKIAILPVGYNDGVDRRLSNVGVVKINDKYCKILGRVSMNITTIDVTDIQNVKIGVEVEIYSSNTNDTNSIINSAKICSTIPYDLLVHLNPFTRREVIE